MVDVVGPGPPDAAGVGRGAFGGLSGTMISPETEPGPRDLERAIDEVRASGAATVFVEPLLSPAIAEAVARESGAQVEVLNPLEGLTDEELDRGEDYFSVMRSNLAALREGLGCR